MSLIAEDEVRVPRTYNNELMANMESLRANESNANESLQQNSESSSPH